MKAVKIIGTGKYIPKKKVLDSELEEKLGIEKGWIERTGGVVSRHYSDLETETTSMMGAQAAKMALENAGMSISDIDLILSASGSQEQVIPSTACFIQRALGAGNSGIPAFDVNSTCLSFLTAMDLAAHYIDSGTYKNILIVSSEIASVGLNEQHKESYTILADGAGAVVVTRSTEQDNCGVHPMLMRTYGSKAELCQIKGGGTKLHPVLLDTDAREEFMFDMNGWEAFRFISEIVEDFMDDLLKPHNIKLQEVDMLVPHQASKMAMEYVIKRRLKVRPEQIIETLPKYGNTIASSIPIALHEGIETQRIKRGDNVLLTGTSAGMSIAGMLIHY